MYGGFSYDDNSSSKALTYQLASLFAGFLYGAGLWLYIDGAAWGVYDANAATRDEARRVSGYSWILIVAMTMVFIALNAMPWHELNNVDDQGAQGRARAFLIVSLVVAIGVLTGAVFIMVERFLNDEELDAYPGISVFASNLIIFASAFVMRFGTLPDEEESMYS